MQVKKHKIKRYFEGVKMFINWAVELLYPPCCPLCDKVLQREEKTLRICRRCQYRLVYITNNRCMKCGKPIASELEEFCYDCKKNRHVYNQARALLSYQRHTRQALYRLKYKNRREYANFFGMEICKVLGLWIRNCHADWLIPIPLHPKKQRVRGYNQAQLLAQVIGRQMGISLLEGVLIKVEETRQQKNLSARERHKNLEAAFQVDAQNAGENLLGRRVILVDDIYTTGATVDAAAQVLLAAGVKAVYVLTVAIGG